MRPALAVLLLASLLTACSGETPAAGGETAALASPGPTEQCGDVESIPLQGEGHLVGDQEPPVPYNSTPPTSGWHTSSDVEFVVADEADPLTEPEQVTVLELGGVVVTYQGVDEAVRGELAAIIRSEYAGRAAMTPHPALGDGEMALTAWGRLQRCEAPDIAAARAFIEAFATAEPSDA